MVSDGELAGVGDLGLHQRVIWFHSREKGGRLVFPSQPLHIPNIHHRKC